MDWDTIAGVFRAELTAERDTDTTVKLPDWVRSCTVTGENIQSLPLGELYYSLKLKRGDPPVVFEADRLGRR